MATGASESASGSRRRKPAKASGLGFLLSRAHQGFRARMAAALEGSGLHLGQVAILGVLAQSNDLSQRELSSLTGIEKSSMVIFLDALEKGNWVERKKHPTDRRAHLVALTEEGRSRMMPVGKRLERAEAENLSIFSQEELGTLTELLTRLTGHVADQR